MPGAEVAGLLEAGADEEGFSEEEAAEDPGADEEGLLEEEGAEGVGTDEMGV